MGAKINTVIPEVIHENEYGPGTHSDPEIKIEFHSVSDIFFMTQGRNKIELCMEQLFQLRDLVNEAIG